MEIQSNVLAMSFPVIPHPTRAEVAAKVVLEVPTPKAAQLEA